MGEGCGEKRKWEPTSLRFLTTTTKKNGINEKGEEGGGMKAETVLFLPYLFKVFTM